jgi:lambda family phage tail tape measure protein
MNNGDLKLALIVQATTADAKAKLADLQSQGAKLGPALRSAGSQAAEGLDQVMHSSTAARRELIVLAHEMAMGNYSRFAGSMLVLGERLDALKYLMSPVGIGIAALAVTVGAAAYQMIEGAADADKLSNSLRLTNDFAGITAGQFRALQSSVADATHGSLSTARDVLQELVSTGRFTSESIGAVARAVVDVADASGEEASKVVADFAKMSAGVAKWAQEHNQQYHFLTLAQYQYIQQLEEQGHVQEAMAQTANLLTTQLESQKQPLGYLPRLWHSLGNAIGEVKQALRDWGAPTTLDAQIAQQQRIVEEWKKSIGVDLLSGGADRSGLAAAQAKLDQLVAQRAAKEKADQDKSASEQEQQRLIDDEERLRKIREQYAGSDLAWLRAHDEAMAAIQVAADRAERAQLEAKLKANQISYADYYRQIATLTQRESAAQITGLRDQLKELDAKRGAEAAHPTPNESDRVEQAAKLAALDAQREAIIGKIAVLERESRDATAESIAKTSEAIDGLQKKFEAARAELQNASADNLADRLRAITDQVHQKYSELVKELKANGLEVDAKVIVKLEDAEIVRQQLQAQLEAIQKQVEATQSRFRDLQAGSSARVQAGIENPDTARTEAKQAAQDATAALEDARKKAEALLQQYPDNPKLLQELRTIDQATADLAANLQTPFERLLITWKNTGDAMRQATANWTQGAADEITKFVTTGKASFRDFTISILQDIAKIEIESAMAGLFTSIGSLFSGVGGGGAAAAGDIGSNIGSLFAASGGLVSGPGTSTSDSIPARLSDGEYVLNTRAVRRVGVATLNAINGGMLPKPLARFAAGGLVGNAPAEPANTHSTSSGITINVPVTVQGDTSTISNQDARNLGNALRNAVRAEIIYQQRPGGALAKS